MKGFVPTPPSLVDGMVEKLFRGGAPHAGSTLLDPGCGSGAFVEGVLRWCQRNGAPIPRITAVDSDPVRVKEARARIGGISQVDLQQQDFLVPRRDRFDFIIGNPPYVAITGLDADERATYRRHYLTAAGRFDLYLLFFEQALSLLSEKGRLVFVTPEKFLYVQSAGRARSLIRSVGVEEIELVDERTFPGLVTYPAVTTISRAQRRSTTRITTRDGTSVLVELPSDGQSWMGAISGIGSRHDGLVLEDAFLRISCGVATGADEVFVLKGDALPEALRKFAYPTISGRELSQDGVSNPASCMLVPYHPDGSLLPEARLGALGAYLGVPERRDRLERRSCVSRKVWYSFHENPPLPDLRRPKILCKDLTQSPRFVPDESGEIVPRHSVYYLVPRDPERLHELCDYLNSVEVRTFLTANCQRAANGFLRLQSHVLKRIPLPAELAASEQLAAV